MDGRTRSSPPGALTFRRVLKAPRDLVFDAWTDPELMALWLHPGPEWSNPLIEVDLRPGGTYRVSFQHKDGSPPQFLGGQFREIVQGERLVYTWIWEEPNDFAGIESLVTVSFRDTQDGTEVHLVHSQFNSEPMRTRHTEGWAATFQCLDNQIPPRP